MIASCPEGNKQCLALWHLVSICSAKIVAPSATPIWIYNR
jgi:hypothetical protein